MGAFYDCQNLKNNEKGVAHEDKNAA